MGGGWRQKAQPIDVFLGGAIRIAKIPKPFSEGHEKTLSFLHQQEGKRTRDHPETTVIRHEIQPILGTCGRLSSEMASGDLRKEPRPPKS